MTGQIVTPPVFPQPGSEAQPTHVSLRVLPAPVSGRLPDRKCSMASCSPSRAWTSDNFLDHLALDEGQPLITSEVRIGEPLLVQPELVQNRRVQIAEVTGLFDCPETDRVGCSDDLASLDASTGQPHREADVVVITPLAR